MRRSAALPTCVLRGLPQGAPLLIAAGMAAVEGGDADRGVEHILRGLEEFRLRGQMRRLALAARRVMASFNHAGMMILPIG